MILFTSWNVLAQDVSLVSNWSSENGVELKWYSNDLVNYEGVNVFRKSGTSTDWKQINDELIQANRRVESSTNDEIEFVNTIVRKQKSLEGIVKLNVMLASFKYKETANIMGVYFWDATATKGIYQYKVQTKLGKVLATTEVDLSETFRVNLPTNFRIDQKRKKLKMFWTNLPMEFYAVNVYALINGVETKLNNYPVMGTDQSELDSAEKFQYDYKLEENTNYEFYIRSIGFFNDESLDSEKFSITMGDITPPSIPKGLNYSQSGRNSVVLKWNDYADSDAKEMVLLRGLEYDSLTEIGVVTLEKLEFIDEPDFSGDVYYAIGARDEAGNMAISERIIVHVEDMFPPAAPENLTAVSDSGRVDLTWGAVSDVDLAGYLLFRSGGTGKDFKLMNAKPLKETKYTFKNSIRSKSAVRFFVLAVDNAYNRSKAIDTITVTMKDYIAPAKPLIKNAEIVNGYVKIIWMANTEKDLKEYQVYRKRVEDTTEFEKVGTVLTGKTTFIDSTCKSLEKYQYIVKAIDEADNYSDKSNVFTLNAPYINALKKEEFAVKWKYKKKKEELRIKWKAQNTAKYMLFEVADQSKQRKTGLMEKTKHTIFEVKDGSKWQLMGYATDGAKYSSQIITIQ